MDSLKHSSRRKRTGGREVVLVAAAKSSNPKPAQASSSDSLSQIEGMVMGVVSAIPVPHFKTWVHAYFHPYEMVENEKGNANFGNVATNAAIIGVIAGLLTALLILITSFFKPSAEGIVGAIIAGAIMVIIYPIIMVIGTFISSAIYFVFAKLMGGKGSYMMQTLGITLISGGTMLLNIPFMVLGIIPCIGAIFSLASLVVSLYALYSEVRMIKAVHQLSTMKAVAVIVLPLIILFVIILVAIAVLGAAFLTMVGGAAAASQYGGY